jgi:hypothetical protein
LGGADLFAPAAPKREPPAPPTFQERSFEVLKASGFWGLIGVVVGSIPMGILGAVLTGIQIETSSRMMVFGGFGATLGGILGVTWGAVRVEELSTLKAIGVGVIVGVPLAGLYGLTLFPRDLMPEAGAFDAIVMGLLAGLMCGAVVSWLNPD